MKLFYITKESIAATNCKQYHYFTKKKNFSISTLIQSGESRIGISYQCNLLIQTYILG